jgi:hypothetical protein
MEKIIIPVEKITHVILQIRGEKVILDHDLAKLYSVSTKALNQAVKRNKGRFPDDFVFQLTTEEKLEVVTNCDHLSNLQFSPSLPYAFTEHGTIMAATLLNSQKAVDVSVFVVRAFVRLRQMALEHTELALKMDLLEKRVNGHDANIKEIVAAIRELTAPAKKLKKKQIGFHWDEYKVTRVETPSKKKSPSQKRKTPANTRK